MQTNQQPIATNIPADHPRVQVVRKHHLLVRWSHWLNMPILLDLILSGIGIYWASPVYQRKPDLQTGNFDYLADVGIWICGHVPGLHHTAARQTEFTTHLSLGRACSAWLYVFLTLYNNSEHWEYFVPSVPLYLRKQRRQASTRKSS